MICSSSHRRCFNTQPPKGGWKYRSGERMITVGVSTHSRLKAAGIRKEQAEARKRVSTHSRLKAAGERTALCFA